MIEAETIIDGRYRVLSRLGSGGMAEVYLAEDQLLGRHVAVKVLHHHFAEDQEFVERFRREASSAAALSHQNIVGIFDRGEWNGTYYIAMEYVAGRSLKTLVREQGSLDPAVAIDIVVQILRGARFAHRRGVVHRDLKPHNVILDEEGRARVTDFGIARAGASDMTLTGSIMGTAQYLSPEQAQGLPVSASSDLYSVGVILYELLTGVVPFEGETAVAIAFKQVSAEPRPPSSVNPSVPYALDAVVLHALAKDPSQRYADADAFIAALQRERRALGTPSGAPAPEASPPQDGYGTGPLLLPAVAPPVEDHDGQPPIRRILLWSGVAALIAGLVVLAIVFLPGVGKVTVPNVVGLTEQTAALKVRQAGLIPVPSATASTTVASGVVFGQTPPSGDRVGKGARVTILVSNGPPTAPLAKVEGLSEAQAVKMLRASGFKPTTTSKPSSSIAEGAVIGTEPVAGTRLPVGSAVTILVSSGPAPVRVPDAVGQSRAAAEAALETADLALGTVTQQVSSAQAPGTVLSQSPPAGTSLRVGGKVNLVVAQAPKEIAVPLVVGQNETQAAAALGRAGFSPKMVTEATTEPTQVGVVLTQSPSAGTRAHKGATVTITVGVLGPQTGPTTTTPTTTTPTTTTPTTTTTPAPAPPAPAG
jgi:beta-lactam-binding protein with PASTA domain/tRNA A-37 threonylcarbamoyl transferase component Bud32